MPLKLRPTGLGSGAYKDSVDYNVLSCEWLIGRIYERNGFPDEVRFFCSLHGVVLTRPPSIHRRVRADARGSQGAVSKRVGMQGVGGVGRGAVNLGDTEQCESDKQGFLNPSGDISPRLVRGFLLP
jgi:hypothetical protein